MTATHSLPLQPGASGGTYIPPEDTFEIKTQGPRVKFLLQAVQPPSSVYVEVDDILQIAAASSQTNEAITVSWRLLKADGVIVENQSVLRVTSNRAINITRQPLTEGFLLSVSCKAAVATTRGQTFVRLFLSNPALGQGQPSYMLMADYVTTAMAPGHPNGRILTPVEGPGFLTVYTIGLQPAGTDWVIFVPTNTRWRVASVAGFLTSDAIAGNRFAVLVIAAGGVVSFRVPASAPNPGNNFVGYSWGPGAEVDSDAVNVFSANFPVGLIIGGPGTGSVSTLTVGMDPGDQWSAIAVTVEEWLDNV